MTTCLGKSCSFGLPRVPFVNCCQFMYLVISLLVSRAGCGILLYQFLIIVYLFTLLQMTLHFMLLQDSCIRHIRVRSKVIILKIADNWKRNRFLYFHFPCFFLTVREYDFIHGPWEKLETSDNQNNALRCAIRQHTQLYYCITSCLASITFNHIFGHRASGSQILS